MTTKEKRKVEGASARLKVLVLGAGGFIGSHLCERLLADGDVEVFGMDVREENVSSVRQGLSGLPAPQTEHSERREVLRLEPSDSVGEIRGSDLGFLLAAGEPFE